MSQNKRVDGIYKILPLFEATIREKDDFALQCYRSYLSRVYIQLVEKEREGYRHAYRV